MKLPIEFTIDRVHPTSGTYVAECLLPAECGVRRFSGRGSDSLAAVADMLADIIESIRQGKLTCSQPPST